MKAILSLVLLVLLSSTAIAKVPDSISYQGYLELGGIPVTDPGATLTFRLHDDAAGGSVLWTETQAGVNISEGVFSVILGGSTSLGGVAFDSQRWLSVAVGGASAIPMSPRLALTSVPYAMSSSEVAGASNVFPSEGHVGVGTTSPEDQLNVHVPSGSGGVLLDTPYSNHLSYRLRNVNTDWAITLNGLQLQVTNGSTPAMSMMGDRVGIGTTDLASRLTVAGTIQSTSGGFKFPDGTVQATAADDAETGWSLAGNAGTTPGTEFVGTSDDVALELKVNGARAFRLEPGTSPNVIGGHSANFVSEWVAGATVSGGGVADETADWGNRVENHYGTIGGGYSNVAGYRSTVGGGAQNSASGGNSTVAGGKSNTATGVNSTVGGGDGNEAAGPDATVGGGLRNAAATFAATVSGGQDNTAEGAISTIGGGYDNITTARYATIGGGHANEAGGEYSTIAGGGQSSFFDPLTRNRVFDNYGAIGGGGDNQVGLDDDDQSGQAYGTISGGLGNAASGQYSTVAGGRGNEGGAPGPKAIVRRQGSGGLKPGWDVRGHTG
jgi:hypothetical protein